MSISLKTKSPFDKWSIPRDRGLQNTPFVEKMMRAPPCVKTESTTIYELQKIMNKGAPLNVRNFITKPPDYEWVHHMIELYKIQLL